MSAASPSENFSFRPWYWWFQAGGWTFYILLNAAILELGNGLTPALLYWLIIAWFACTALTELFRLIIIKYHWLRLRNTQVVPRLVVVVILMSSVMATTSILYEEFINEISHIAFDVSKWFRAAASYGLAFTVWSALYFLINTLENFRKAEIENLKWEAIRNETELNRLKSQLNPHFMFNAMNVIRALVDENPARSKEAITHLSSLLRNTLQAGKHKLIPLNQELEVVDAYLALESARMEERLRVHKKINFGSYSYHVPPLMIQTLVENCIKHGISKFPEGGDLNISIEGTEDGLRVAIENSGYYDEKAVPESGFGLRNTIERLALLFGDRAEFSIRNSDHGTVVTELFIPKTEIV